MKKRHQIINEISKLIKKKRFPNENKSLERIFKLIKGKGRIEGKKLLNKFLGKKNNLQSVIVILKPNPTLYARV